MDQDLTALRIQESKQCARSHVKALWKVMRWSRKSSGQSGLPWPWPLFLGRVMTPNIAGLCLLHLSNQFSPLSGHILMVIFIQSSVWVIAVPPGVSPRSHSSILIGKLFMVEHLSSLAPGSKCQQCSHYSHWGNWKYPLMLWSIPGIRVLLWLRNSDCMWPLLESIQVLYSANNCG